MVALRHGTRRERRELGWRGVAVAATAAAMVAVLPSTAYAAVLPLPDATVVTSTVANTYTYSTSTFYWSVVAIQPSAGTDWDLQLRNAGGVIVSGSTWGSGRTDFVAVNSNSGFQPFGGFRATSIKFSSNANQYWAEQVQGRTVTTLPTPANDGVSGPSDPDLAFAVLPNQFVITVVDVWLNAGQKFWADEATAGDRLYLLESDPANATTFLRNRSQAAVANHVVVDGCTLYTASFTGWHGLVMVHDSAPGAPGTGFAYALHRFNPAKPTTCPVKNFPAPTPP